MRRPLLAATVALAASACGDISNQPLEDLAFVRALPRAADVALAGPEDGAGAQALEAGAGQDATDACSDGSPRWVFCLGHQLADLVNAITAQTLWIVDAVRALPPTERDRDFRAWGPYPDDQHPGRRWRLEVTRAREAAGLHYAWKVLLFPPGETDPVEAIVGGFRPGPGGTSRGIGSFTWNGRAARDRGLAAPDDPDELAIGYDLTAEPRTIGARLTGVDGTVVDFANERATSGAGGWSYAVDLAIDDGRNDGVKNDLLEARARWADDRAGRADAQLMVDSVRIPPGPYAIRSCWGRAPDFAFVYYDNEVQPGVCGAGGCPVGDAAACRFPPLF
jgi:hypothetical protein